MQKTLFVVVLSLLSLFFSQQALANDVRLCLASTNAAAVQTAPQTANSSFSGLYSVATNQAGTYLWAIHDTQLFRYQVNASTGNIIESSAIRIGTSSGGGTNHTGCVVQRRSICNPYSVYVDSLDRLWVVDNGLRRVLQYNNASITNFTGKVTRPVKVIGAADFVSWNSANNISFFNLSGPQSVVYYAADDTLYILDSDQFGSSVGTASRVLRYDLISQQPSGAVTAQVVLGQSDFNTLKAGSASSSRLGYAEYIDVDQNKGDLYVADSTNNRVVVFTSAQDKSTGDSANKYIGQSSSSGSSSGTSSKSLDFPTGVRVDNTGNQLFIADNGNNRVVVVSKLSSLSTGPTFTTVIGQSSFKNGSANQGGSVAANTLNSPFDVTINNVTGYIYVADEGNNRLTVYGPCLVDQATPSISASKQSVSGTPAGTGSNNVTASHSFNSTQVVTTSPSVTLVSGSPSTSVASVSPSTSPISFTTGGSTGTTGTTGARRLRRRL